MTSALELQISTQRAQEALKQIERSIDHLRQTLDRFGTVRGWETFLQRVQGFRGVDPAVAASFRELQRVLGSFATVSNLSNVSKELSALTRLKVGNLANNVQRLATALAAIKVPPAVTRLASDLRAIATAAHSAAPAVRDLGAALKSVKMPAGFASVVTQINKIQPAASSATSSLVSLKGAFTLVSSALATLGITSAINEIREFVKSSYDAYLAWQRFDILITSTTDSQKAAGRYWEHIKKLAKETGSDVLSLAYNFSKFTSSVVNSGQSMEDAVQLFDDLVKVSRVLKLDVAQTNRYFLAFDQIVTKGTISTEELKRQLGELFPAFTLLAQGMGMSTAELHDALKKGAVSSMEVFKLVAEMVEKYQGGFEKAFASIQSGFNRLSNSVTYLKMAFGEAFFSAILPSIEALAEALDNDAFREAAANFGTLAGTLAGYLVDALRLTVQHWDILKYAILGVLGLAVGAMVNGWVRSFLTMVTALTTVTRVVAGVTVALTVMSATQAVINILRVAIMGLAAAMTRLWTALGPIGVAIAALVVATPSLVSLYNRLTGSTKDTAEASSEATGEFKEEYSTLDQLVARFQSYYNQNFKSVEAQQRLSESTNRLTTYFERQEDHIDRLIDRMRRAEQAARDLARAQRDLANSGGGSVGGGDGGGDGGEGGSSYAGGGIVGQGKRFTYAPASAWVGAPMAATGMANTNAVTPTLPGNGIPIIAHPNEAVVPLTNGGEIPVETRQTITVASPPSEGDLRSLSVLREIHLATVRTWESVDQHTILMKEEWDIQHANMVLLTQKLGEINTNLILIQQEIKEAISRSSMPTTSPDPTIFEPEETEKNKNNLPFNGGNIIRGWFGTSNQGGYLIGPGYGFNPETYFGWPGHGGLFWHHTGTPNVSKDEYPTILKKDEAVIPLPDGRTVPVQLPDDATATWRRLDDFLSKHEWVEPAPRKRVNTNEDSKRENSQRTWKPQVNINMTVNAQDARSFAESKKQIMQELQAEITRALRNIGPRSKYEDPTRRV